LEWKKNFNKELEEKERATKNLTAIKKEEAKKLKPTGKSRKLILTQKIILIQDFL